MICGLMNRYVLICALSAILSAEGAALCAPEKVHDLLIGNVPGLLVVPGDGSPGSTPKIRIRGSVVNSSAGPLVVIDGVPMSDVVHDGMINHLEMLNPDDIEKFYVLKDASAVAVYGARASNGAIVIITKKGTGERAHVSYNGSFSVRQNSAAVPVMSASDRKSVV